MIDDPTAPDATALAAALRACQLSCRELMAAVLDRIARLNPAANAIVALQPRDALLVQRPKAAGAIVIGKTTTPEWGLGSHTDNPVHGITRNACNPAPAAGGPSGGAAVAFALRLLPLAERALLGAAAAYEAAIGDLLARRPPLETRA